jgi:quercetin dioxygenase-like cupin family protein
MKATNHILYDTVITIYTLNKDESVPWHKHDFIHTTCCLNGKSKVIVDGFPPVSMYPGTADVYLPGGVYHEVMAMEDNTILMHCFKREYLGIKSTPESAFTPDMVNPGYLMDDGTIQYD